MKATWTTQSGKNVELETVVIGKTARDHIHTQYNLVIDGKDYKVIRPAIVKGQHCLEIFVPPSSKQMLAMSSDIAKVIADELKAVIDSVPSVDISISKYDQDFDKLTRLMAGDHSDH